MLSFFFFGSKQVLTTQKAFYNFFFPGELHEFSGLFFDTTFLRVFRNNKGKAFSIRRGTRAPVIAWGTEQRSAQQDAATVGVSRYLALPPSLSSLASSQRGGTARIERGARKKKGLDGEEGRDYFLMEQQNHINIKCRFPVAGPTHALARRPLRTRRASDSGFWLDSARLGSGGRDLAAMRPLTVLPGILGGGRGAETSLARKGAAPAAHPLSCRRLSPSFRPALFGNLY